MTSCNYLRRFFFFFTLIVCLASTGIGRSSYQQENEQGIQSQKLDENGAHKQSSTIPQVYAEELFFPAFGKNDFPALGNVLFDLSHNPYFGSSFGSRHSSFITHLNALGFNVVIASDFNNLGNYDVVIQELPRIIFSSGDIVLLENYLNGGGILHVTGEYEPWTENSLINNMLFNLDVGIQMKDPVVYEPTNIYNGNHIQILIYDFTDHCLNDNVSVMLHPATGYLQLDNPDSALYYSSSASYLRDYTSVTGPFPLAAIPDPSTHPNWKMIVVTDSSHFTTSSTDYFSLYDNTQLATNWVLWCEEDECEINEDCDDGDFCNGAETCNTSTFECEAGTPPCPDDGLWCNGAEGCDETGDTCTAGTNPCPDDGLFCNGSEGCDEANDQCTAGTNPCPDDALFCNGTESCDETNDICMDGTDPCPDDGLWCNGVEGCDETGDTCTAGTNPCPDDGLFCNGSEGCDEANDQCTAGTNPCPDDAQFCNGVEACDDVNDECFSSGDPCVDDGQFCNGEEQCNETLQECVSTGNPCPDDGQWCNGEESCNEDTDECGSIGQPCEDDGLFCNGEETCDETNDQCSPGVPPCEEDETCNEDTDTCDRGEDDDSDPEPSEDDDDAAPNDDEVWPKGKVSGGCCGC